MKTDLFIGFCTYLWAYLFELKIDIYPPGKFLTIQEVRKIETENHPQVHYPK